MREEPIVRLEGVVRRFGAHAAVDGVSLDVEEGEFFSLLGPSGSGKTTLLRLIAGFERPDAGSVTIGGRPMRGMPPERRPVNTVFQSYALFPTMSVFENVAYGLHVRRVRGAELRQRVEAALALVGLEEFAGRSVTKLSGGQAQRVALARALVLEPRVLLLDEPLGALDLKLRQRMQTELKALQQQVGITFIYVTHDQEEALTMSDRVAVMSQGRLEQVGAPLIVYRRPATAFVAGFLGDTNLITVVHDSRDRPLVGGHPVPVAEGGLSSGVWSLRPESIRLGEEAERQVIRLPARVLDVVFLGSMLRYRVRVGKSREAVVLLASASAIGEPLPVGSDTLVGWDPSDVVSVAEHKT